MLGTLLVFGGYFGQERGEIHGGFLGGGEILLAYSCVLFNELVGCCPCGEGHGQNIGELVPL